MEQHHHLTIDCKDDSGDAVMKRTANLPQGASEVTDQRKAQRQPDCTDWMSLPISMHSSLLSVSGQSLTGWAGGSEPGWA